MHKRTEASYPRSDRETLLEGGSQPKAGFLTNSFVAVFDGVVLAGFFGLVRGVVKVAFRCVRMVDGLLVIARLMVFGRGEVMFSGVFVMLRSVFGHVQISSN